MKITKKPKFLTWLMLIISLAVLLGAGFYIIRNSLRHTLFSELNKTTQSLQEELHGGTSPNGALSDVFYYLSGEPDFSKDIRDLPTSSSRQGNSFGVVVEETKSYITSSAKIDGLMPVPPIDFLANTKTQGSSQLIWHPKKGIWVAINSLTYNYGDVFGYAVTGKPANSYVIELSLYLFVSIITWLVFATVSYKKLVKLSTKKT